MLSVAFFRNLNQGQRASPTGAALLAAFAEAGATNVSAYRGNGTVIFEAGDPRSCAESVVKLLGGRSPWRDVVFVREAEWLVGLSDELAARPSDSLDRTELSFFDEAIALDDLPRAGVRCTIVAGGPGYAITINELPKTSQATPSIERLIDSPATSRGVGTLIGLAGRLTG